MNARQKRILKLTLDAVMLILLVLMYKKQVVSISFHEIGGLALIGLFVIHLLFNAKWIGAVTKRLFAKTIPAHVRACYIVDALLLIAFLTIGVSGIFISKVVFSVHISGNYKTLHYFASAVAVILMGVHLGLHADYIFGKLLRKGAKKTRKIVLTVVLVLIAAFGTYSLFASSFVSYLAAPIQAASLSHSVPSPTGEAKLDGSTSLEQPLDLSELPDKSNDSDGTQPPQSDESIPSDANGEHQFSGGDRHSGQGGGNGNGNVSSGGSLAGALTLIAQYISLIVLFAVITYPFTKLFRRHGPKSEPDPLCDDGSLLDESAVEQIAETAGKAKNG